MPSPLPEQTSFASTVRTVVRAPLAWRAPEWFTIAVLGPLLAIVGALLSERIQLRDHVLPNVVFEGHEVEGYSRDALLQVLQAESRELGARVVSLQVGEPSFRLALSEIDAKLDTELLAERMLNAGRSGNWRQQISWRLARYWRQARIEPEVRVDPQRWEERLSAFERSALQVPEEGGVLVKAGRPVKVLPRAGQRVDREQAREQLLSAIRERRTSLVMPLEQHAPSTTAAAVDEAARQMERVLAGPVRLTLLPPVGEHEPLDAEEREANAPQRTKLGAKSPPGPRGDEPRAAPAPPLVGPMVSIEVEQLAAALETEVDPDEPTRLLVQLAPQQLESWLAPVRARWERPPKDAEFVIGSGEEIEILPGRVAWQLDAGMVAAELLAAAEAPSRAGSVRLVHGNPPRVTTELAGKLNIRGLVSRFTTHHSCCQPRVKNIHRIADLLNGIVLFPGEVFSVNDYVGPRSEDGGFQPAPTIVKGEIRDTHGGGISQFATTLFNALLDGGYDVVERQPHSFYFSRYPLGHEATLSYPKPDLVFRNDTSAGLLIRTRYGSTYITVEIYGDNNGRRVEKEVSERYDWVEPPLEYIADETLAPDEEHVEFEGERGFSVDVSRTVIELNGERRTEGRRVNYRPRPRQIAMHPCRIPEDEPEASKEPCPVTQGADAGAEAYVSAPELN